MDQHIETAAADLDLNAKKSPFIQSKNTDVGAVQNRQETRENRFAELVAEINKIRPIHKQRGICYASTVTALSTYRKVKFNSIESKRLKFIEHLQAKDIEIGEHNPFYEVFEKLALLDRHNKNRTDNVERKMLESASLIQRIDIALEWAFQKDNRIDLKAKSSENKLIKRIIEQKYFLFKTATLTTNELIKLSGYKKSEYYRMLEEGIERISIALWGVLGEEHPQLNALLNQIIKSK